MAERGQGIGRDVQGRGETVAGGFDEALGQVFTVGEGDGMDEHVHAAPFFFHERGGGGDVLVAGHVAGEDKLTAELLGDGFHALVDGFTGIAERQPGSMFLKAGSDSVRDASVVGYPEDEALFVFQQHDFLVVGLSGKGASGGRGKAPPVTGKPE